MTKKDVKDDLRDRGCVPEAVRGAKSAGNHPDLSNGTERGSWEIFTAGLGGHEEFLIDQVRRRRPLGDKAQLEMVDDAIDHGEEPLARASGVLKEPIRPR
jgi:hypothetical protein